LCAHIVIVCLRYVEAKDNVKFLTTLERHFKNISSGNLTAILDTLPSMMNALRMVWVISRHYNTDDQMLPLMRRIASEIADKVSATATGRVCVCACVCLCVCVWGWQWVAKSAEGRDMT
jgi:hypothetical protein